VIEGATPVELADEQPSPTSIAFYKGILYWSNYYSGAIMRVVP
jgi:hypothetical protein